MNFQPCDQVIVTMPDGHELFGVIDYDERDTPTLLAMHRGRVHVVLGNGVEIIAPPESVRPLAPVVSLGGTT